MSRREEALTFGSKDIRPIEAYVPRKNKSYFFVLPLLGYPSYWYYGIVNCYLQDNINKPELNYRIFINVKNYDNRILNILEFNQFYQLEDKTYMYVFDIPHKFTEDYYLFSEGKYSQMSEEAKQLICKLSGVKPIQESVVYKVLYKTADQKAKIEDLIGEKLSQNAEVFSRPDLSKETYDLLRIKNSSIVDIVEREEDEER